MVAIKGRTAVRLMRMPLIPSMIFAREWAGAELQSWEGAPLTTSPCSGWPCLHHPETVGAAPAMAWADRNMSLEFVDILDFDLEGILIGLALAAAAVILIFVGVPLIIFLVDTLLIIPFVVAIGIVGRVMFRRPWTIEAVSLSGTRSWNVVRWGASSRAAGRMATLIAGVGDLPTDSPGDMATPRAPGRSVR